MVVPLVLCWSRVVDDTAGRSVSPSLAQRSEPLGRDRRAQRGEGGQLAPGSCRGRLLWSAGVSADWGGSDPHTALPKWPLPRIKASTTASSEASSRPARARLLTRKRWGTMPNDYAYLRTLCGHTCAWVITHPPTARLFSWVSEDPPMPCPDPCRG